MEILHSLTVSDDLTVSIGPARAKLSVGEALEAAERLARNGLRRAMQEGAASALGVDPDTLGGAHAN